MYISAVIYHLSGLSIPGHRPPAPPRQYPDQTLSSPSDGASARVDLSMTAQGSVLFIDAYDSFAENIAALLRRQLHVEVTLIRIDCAIQSRFNESNRDFFSSFDAIILGPGPGNPSNDSDVGLFNQVWEHAANENIPVLGICLGFQSLCIQYGLPVVRMGLPCHGHAKEVYHMNRDIFVGAGNVLATNYNSLGVRLRDFKQEFTSSRRSSTGSFDSHSSSQSLQSAASIFSKPAARRPRHRPAENLEVLAWDKDDWVMAVRHKDHPFHGFQFHPESCKSNFACHNVVKQWWETAKAHNRVCRTMATPKAHRINRPSLSRQVSSDATALESKITRLGKQCSGDLTCITVPMTKGAQEIAPMCYNMSPSSTVVMLESTKRGRYSIYAFPDDSSFQIEYAESHCTLIQGTSPVDQFQLDRDEVVTLLETFMHSKSIKDDNTSGLPFRGGFVGFISYEFGIGSLDLDLDHQQGPATCIPDVSLLWVDRCIVFDHHTGKAHIQSIRDQDSCWVDEMADKLEQLNQTAPAVSDELEGTKLQQILSSTAFSLPDHDEYVSNIRSCQSELLAGNSYELCLTTEATVTTPVSPTSSWLVYKNIQRHNPVPFASYMRLNKTTILSSSPEHFLSWSHDGTIDMLPMKGTVKKTPDLTMEKATAILGCAKESAENLMIADLIRHDLSSTVGRDALVEVIKLCDVVETETVFSLISHIRAHVPFQAGTDSSSTGARAQMTRYGIKALAHTLPPGSMTGAPKKRSCEILHRLEQRRRGVYSGAIGYMDVAGNGAWSVCIRTAFSHDDENEPTSDGGCVPGAGEARQKWHIGAGGAITVLSDDEQEWEEMMTKLDSVLRGFRPR